MNKRDDWNEKRKKQLRYMAHFSFAALLLVVIVIFRAINKQAVIDKLFTIAGYTYGPLLGLFAFGLFTKLKVRDPFVPFICLFSPMLCYILSENSANWFNGYKFDFELLILNGALTFTGLWLISFRKPLLQS